METLTFATLYAELCTTGDVLTPLKGIVSHPYVDNKRNMITFTTGNDVPAMWAAAIVRLVLVQEDFVCYCKVDGIEWGKTRGTVLKLWD